MKKREKSVGGRQLTNDDGRERMTSSLTETRKKLEQGLAYRKRRKKRKK